jgi:hypothetical protein
MRVLALCVVGLLVLSGGAFAMTEGGDGGGASPAPAPAPSSGGAGGPSRPPDLGENASSVGAPAKEAPRPPADVSKLLELVYRVTDDRKQRAIWMIHEEHKGWKVDGKALTVAVRLANAVTSYVNATGDGLSGFVSDQLLAARKDAEKLKGKSTTVRRKEVGIRVRPCGAWRGVANPDDKLTFTGKFNAGWFEVKTEGRDPIKGWVPIIWLRAPGTGPAAGDDETQKGEGDDPSNRSAQTRRNSY